jgi:hypothetical protein
VISDMRYAVACWAFVMQGKFIYCRTVVSIIAVTLSAVQGGPDSGFAIVLILFALNGAVLNYE